MSIELQYNRLHLPGLTVVEKQRQNVKEEMMGFVTALRDDPMALSMPSEGRVGNTYKIPFKYDDSVTLESSYWHPLLEDCPRDTSWTVELAVSDIDGSARFSAYEYNLDTIDIQNDSFAQLVLSYFRRHYREDQ